MSSKDNDEECALHWKGDNIENMIYDKVDEVIKELFQSLLSRHHIELETSMKGSDLVFDCVHLLCYKNHRKNFKRGISCVDILDWIKNRKPKISKITIALIHKEIGQYSKRISKVKPFVNKYN